tara:strand:+ start:1564 stop:1785 length:222 start_codon:yes stop_codon:yes gene_type:complete
MTPKDKALELYNKYEQLGRDFTRGVSMKEFAKECALIAVDEILLIAPMMHMEGFGNLTIREYYKKVKQEIEKL